MELSGWLLDVYLDPSSGGVKTWLLCDDGRRVSLRHRFPISFFAAGSQSRLQSLWKFLSEQPVEVTLERQERQDLFAPAPVAVVRVRVAQAAEQQGLFRAVDHSFPDLDYYDADIELFTRYAAQFDVFPLCRCQVKASQDGWIEHIVSLDSRWDIDPLRPALKVLLIEPDADPFHLAPTVIQLQYERTKAALPLDRPRPLLVSLASFIRRSDPDLILTRWGDTWLLPKLIDLSEQLSLPIALNRDEQQAVGRRKEMTYHSYGQVVHRGQQVLLSGRWHIDTQNAMLFADYGLDGVFESARVTSLPVQAAARKSPGAGILAMQIITALRKGILVPYRKQQTEYFKSAVDLIQADRGPLIFQPIVGLHENVAELDFHSMFAKIISEFNIDPTTVTSDSFAVDHIPTLAEQDDPQGLVPETLAPLIEKRLVLKERIAGLHAKDCRYRAYKARSSALKWLLVVSFGYLGYKNAVFGRIESHQAVTAYAREAALVAKEVVEEQGFMLLHLYVDGLYIQKEGAARPADFQEVMDEIARRTRLPIGLDGIFRWVAFLPSKVDRRVPVPNRYFGVFQNGELKVRGLEARRSDTPAFVAGCQMDILRLLSRAETAAELRALLPEAVLLLRERAALLRQGQVELEQLVVSQRLTRSTDEYLTLSPAAVTAQELELHGRSLSVGQRARFLYVRGRPRVAAWDSGDRLDPLTVDCDRYLTLLIRAAASALEPLGVSEALLREWCSGAFLPGQPGLRLFSPQTFWR